MSEDAEVWITLRLPKSLRSSLVASLKETRRSMNAEIIYRLESSFSQRQTEANDG